MAADQQTLEHVADLERYKHGFVSDIDQEFAPKGLSEATVRFVSAKKGEPEWMLDWRLEAYRRWIELEEPDWARVNFPAMDYQDSYYYAAPKEKAQLGSLDEVDPEILAVYAKLGIPLKEQEVLAGVKGAPRYAVDAVFDSVSVVTTFKKELAEVGVIFCSMSATMATWCASIWGRWCPSRTTTSRASTARSFQMAASSMCRLACVAPWSFPPISASTPPNPASSKEP